MNTNIINLNLTLFTNGLSAQESGIIYILSETSINALYLFAWLLGKAHRCDGWH